MTNFQYFCSLVMVALMVASAFIMGRFYERENIVIKIEPLPVIINLEDFKPWKPPHGDSPKGGAPSEYRRDVG